jgi:hypothetical protein
MVPSAPISCTAIRHFIPPSRLPRPDGPYHPHVLDGLLSRGRTKGQLTSGLTISNLGSHLVLVAENVAVR